MLNDKSSEVIMAVSAVDLAKQLGGMDFPANKQGIIDYAQQKNASEEMMNILRQMPEREYGNMADVEQGFGEVK
jgi:hypothetical protein